jgi:Protein of unknown function (DUF3309)
VGTILLIILILLLVGALPTWPYSSGWGYYPSGGLGLVLHPAYFGADGTNIAMATRRKYSRSAGS